MDLSLNIDGKKINISNFDSGEFEEFMDGRKNVTIDFTCKRDDSDTTGVGNLIDDWFAGNEGAVSFCPKTPVAGDISYSGTGSPSNIKISAPDDEDCEITGSLQINGVLQKSTT
ncbi:MAG: hypothetical protein JXL67_06190 [Calditrichaeota bacterium]|nr:hypothetical protein [Calditrichota bacterium]